MDARKVFVALVLIATFALPSLATFEKDFITPETVRAVLKKINFNEMPSEEVINALTGKVLVSNIVLQEVLLKNLDNGLKPSYPCGGESCVFHPCISSLVGCSCNNKICTFLYSPAM